MKLNQPNRNVTISKNNAVDVATALQGIGPDFQFYGLLAAIAELADDIAGGADAFCTFGSTKSRDAFVFTVKYNGVGTPVYDADLEGISRKLEDLL